MVSRKTTPARIGHLCSAKGAKCYLMKEIVFLHIGPGGCPGLISLKKGSEF